MPVDGEKTENDKRTMTEEIWYGENSRNLGHCDGVGV